MEIELVHRTGYLGRILTPTADPNLGEIPLLWTQAIPWEEQQRPCCPGFGSRSVQIQGGLLKEVHAGAWGLWHVGWRRGDRNRDHLFHDFVLAMDSGWMDDYASGRGWDLVGAGKFRRGMGILQAGLPFFKNKWHTTATDEYGYLVVSREDWEDVQVHCHVGILLPSNCIGLDTQHMQPVWDD